MSNFATQTPTDDLFPVKDFSDPAIMKSKVKVSSKDGSLYIKLINPDGKEFTFENYEVIENMMRIFRFIYAEIPTDQMDMFIDEIQNEKISEERLTIFIDLAAKIYEIPEELVAADDAVKRLYWTAFYKKHFLSILKKLTSIMPSNLDPLIFIDEIAISVTGQEVISKIITNNVRKTLVNTDSNPSLEFRAVVVDIDEVTAGMQIPQDGEDIEA